MDTPFRKVLRLPYRGKRPPLTVQQVLDWADAYYKAKGRWPSKGSGRVKEDPFGTTWRAIDTALFYGSRCLPDGLSLARLLCKYRGLKPRVSEERMRRWAAICRRLRRERRLGRATLTVERILAAADAYHAAKGRWPNLRSGPIPGIPGETWSTINSALMRGHRDLPERTSLARFLVKHRGREALNGPPTLTVEAILGWADAFHATHGRWPIEASGRVPAAPRETWKRISLALLRGARGLPGGSSLARLLAEHRGVRNPRALPPLTAEQILAWADAHHAATGHWPTDNSGAVRDAPGEDWGALDTALYAGFRGLPGGSSLARLLNEHHPERRRPLTVELIHTWAEAHHQAHGFWPSSTSGTVEAAPHEDWAAIDACLRHGNRGLPGGSSLVLLYGRACDPQLSGPRPKLTIEQILAWGATYHAAIGRWPHRNSGAVPGAPGEKWVNIDEALRHARRGLPIKTSLRRLFADRPTPAPASAASKGRAREGFSRPA